MSAATVLGVYFGLLGGGALLDGLWPWLGWLLIVLGGVLIGWGMVKRGSHAP